MPLRYQFAHHPQSRVRMPVGRDIKNNDFTHKIYSNSLNKPEKCLSLVSFVGIAIPFSVSANTRIESP